MGLRYHGVCPTADFQALAAAMRAAANNIRAHYINKDRGVVSANNDLSFDARAVHFGSWLERHGFDEHSLAALSKSLFLDVLAAYLDAVGTGDNCQHIEKLSEQIMRLYLNAGSAVLALFTGQDCSTLDPATVAAKRPSTQQRYLFSRFSQRAA